ncbi:hypothetical protein MPSEU_000146900 [Mayamaea pseudoterrestris]|nr:hypothetical protein MPSEU_000146900 [Mayamaea pseudoterrestris]
MNSTRQVVDKSAPTAAPAARRAFKDVSNVRNSAVGKQNKAVVATKRSTGVKTRSMERNPDKVVVARAPMEPMEPNAFAAMQQDAFPTLREVKKERDIKKDRRSQLGVDPASYQMTGSCDDIDERDKEDPLCVTAYVDEMYDYFRGKEESTSVRPVYMESQKHINERMRSILIDWLVEVHLKFKLVPETLYLTVNLIDRYLERQEVTRPRLQLVGVTCLLIASKYEEIYPPELRDLVYICDRAYTRQDIIEMEETVLKALAYNITIPSAHVFLVRHLKAGHADKKIVQLSCYILDGTLQSYNLLHYLPSQLAAAAVFIARRSVGRNGWSATMVKYADYFEEEIIPVARAILAEKANSNQELRAVNKKYSSQRYGGVANTAISCDF